jgi:hypothetical protein
MTSKELLCLYVLNERDRMNTCSILHYSKVKSYCQGIAKMATEKTTKMKQAEKQIQTKCTATHKQPHTLYY